MSTAHLGYTPESSPIRVMHWSLPLDGEDHEIGAGKVVLVAQQTPRYTLEGHDSSRIGVWTEERPPVDLAVRKRTVRAVRTTVAVDPWHWHLGSCLSDVGREAWHVYEIREPTARRP